MGDVAQLIADHPFSAGFSDGHLATLASCATGEVSWGAGKAVLVTGEPAEVCYLILSGSLSLSAESPGVGSRVIQTVPAGGVLGLSWIFPPHRWIFDAVTLEPTTAIAFEAARLRQAIDSDAAFGLTVVTKMASYLYGLVRFTRLQLLDLYGHRG